MKYIVFFKEMEYLFFLNEISNFLDSYENHLSVRTPTVYTKAKKKKKLKMEDD